MIKKDTTFQFAKVISNFCMKHDGNTTQAVLATIRCRATKGRDGPPACGNGFDTSYLPFAKGHVIALELGGSDEPFNVVPQFEDWQGKLNGAWRKMEVALSKYPGHVMLVEINYDRPGPDEEHETAVTEFQSDRLRNWLDKRIPNKFNVRVWNSTENPADINGDGEFVAMVNRLNRGLIAYQSNFDLGTGLPEPDRSMYVNQAALSVAQDLWNEEEVPSFVEFMLTPGTVEEVREELAVFPSIAPTEANVQAFPIMFAYQAGLTASKVRRLMNVKDNKGIKRANSDLVGLPPAKKKKKDED